SRLRPPTQSGSTVSRPRLSLLEMLDEQLRDARDVFLDDLGDVELLADTHLRHADIERLALAVAIIRIEQHRLAADGGRHEFLARLLGRRCTARGRYPEQRLALDRRAMFEHAGNPVAVEDDGLGLQRRRVLVAGVLGAVLQPGLPFRTEPAGAGDV